ATAPAPAGSNDDWKVWQAGDSTPPEMSTLQKAGEVAKGFGKGALETVQDMSPAHLIAKAMGQQQGFDTDSTNGYQTAGKVAEVLGELAIPGAEGVKALPSAT